MDTKKLIIILALIIVVNFTLVYFLFYYNPIIEPFNLMENHSAVSFNEAGNKAGFWVKEKNDPIFKIRVYDLLTEKYKDYPIVLNAFDFSSSDSISFSPDDKKIAFVASQEQDHRRVMFILDLESGSHINLKEKLDPEELGLIDNSHSADYAVWLDNNTLVYDNVMPFHETGIVFVDLKNYTKKNYIYFGSRPSLSHDKKSLVYFRRRISDEKQYFDIEEFNVQTNSTSTISTNLEIYPRHIYFSPTDQLMAASYSLPDQDIPYYQVAIIDQNNNFKVVDKNKILAQPQWIDDKNLLVVQYQRDALSFLGAKAINIRGLYLFNLKSGQYRKITSKIKSSYVYVSLDGKMVICSAGKNSYLIEIDRIFNPILIDKIRSFLGIASL